MSKKKQGKKGFVTTTKGLKAFISLAVIGAIVIAFGVGIGLDYANVAWNVDAYTQTVDASTKAVKENEMKVMSFNIRCYTCELVGKHRWGLRAPLVFETIENSMPDILGVQELKKKQEKHFDKYLVGYGKYAPYRKSKGLSAEACGIFWKESRFTLLDKGVFWLSETPEKESIGWDAALERICSWVKLKDINEKELYVFNAHLDHLGEKARIESLKLIQQKIDKVGDTNVILLGDLNFPENAAIQDVSNPYQYVTSFLDDSKYAEGVEITKARNTFHGYEKVDKNSPPIDFILYKPNRDLKPKVYGVIDAKIDGKFPSDHYPVQVTFEYK
ncbi:MAG TPA: endonuclease/exonuclease/phosphatase family protein [Clostridiales bacterium]|nr:endonuclease/exonuclease/phosphatase family protein [Clostridiales bacterium]